MTTNAKPRRGSRVNPIPAEQPDPQAQIEWLSAQLQDAQLIIGQQQMSLLRAEQVIRQLQQQLEEAQTSG